MKILFNLLILIISSETANAQLGIVYSMGVMGSNLTISTNSNPLSVNSSNCLQVTNGISKFLANNTGVFINDCVVNLNYTKLSIQVLPNPFVDAVYITFKSKIDNDNHFKISVFNSVGNLVKVTSVFQDLFYSRFKLPLSELPSGLYFMHINSNKVNEVFKIIKNE